MKHLFSSTGYIFLQENVCFTLLPKNAHGITQWPTLIEIHHFIEILPGVPLKIKMDNSLFIDRIYMYGIIH